MSLRVRLLLGLGLLVLFAVGTATWTVGQLAQRRVAAALSGRVLELAQPILATLEEAGTIEEAAQRGQRLQQRGVALEIVVADTNGKGVNVTVDDARLVAALRGPPFIYQSGEDAYVYAALRKAGGLLGAVRIKAGSDDPERLWRELSPMLWIVAALDAGLIILFGAMFLRRVVNPLGSLSDAARRVAAGELDLPPLAEHENDDELGRLIRSFNGMTRSLREQRDQVVAQAKLATVGRLAAGVAHEIGNPLSAIVGYLAMLRDDLDKLKADPTSREMLDRAQKEADRMRSLIAELVDYARPVPPKQEPVALAPLVRAAIDLVRPQSRLRGVEFVVDEASLAEANVRGDEARLQQVLINLFFNAADAMGGDGKIHLRAERRGDHLALFIADDGPGVAPEHRGAIFDPFFTTKAPGEGTGLGLAVSRSIVEALGGKLALVASAEGGATFALELVAV